MKAAYRFVIVLLKGNGAEIEGTHKLGVQFFACLCAKVELHSGGDVGI